MPESYANQPTGDHQPIGEVHPMPDQSRKNFAKRLKSLRQLHYHTAEDFASVLGIQGPRYRKWELGKAEPSIALLLRVCQLLGTTPDFLLLGIDKIIYERTAPAPAKTITLKTKNQRSQ